MVTRRRRGFFVRALGVWVILILLMSGCGQEKESQGPGKITLKVGFFPNLTHAQAIAGIGDGTFQRFLGKEVRIEPHVFNAGPTALEAMLAGELDLAYMGPVPAMNGAWRSKGALEIIAGSCEGGSILVVRKGSSIADLRDLRGKKVAVPQLANTQDLLLRRLLAGAGLKTLDRGGDVTVIPVENPDILALFQRGNLDAALVPEPWGSRLVEEGGGKILLDWNRVWEGGGYPSTVLVARREFLSQHPALIQKWLQAHRELTHWLAVRPTEAREAINRELKVLTGKPLPAEILEKSFSRMVFTTRVEEKPWQELITVAAENGYGKGFPEPGEFLGMIQRKDR